MAVTLETIITTARDRHPAFDERRTPNAACARFVTNYQRQLQAKALTRNRRTLLVSTVVSFPLPNFAAGVALPANVYVEDGAATTKDDIEYPLSIIDPTLIYSEGPFPFAWLDGARLMLAGLADDWANFANITVRYVPAVVPMTALSDTIVLPDEASPAITDNLAAFLYSRGHTDASLPAISISQISLTSKLAQQSESDFLDSLGSQRVGRVMQVPDGY